MAEAIAVAEVRIWGRTVGAVAELDDRRVVFEYDAAFRRTGLEISPIRLPLALTEPVSFPELSRKPAFDGLPGVLADSLPDSFGNRVIRAYFSARGETARALSPVQRLLYVGERGLGALTFHPATELVTRAPEQESLEIAALVRDARRVIEGQTELTLPEIYRIGSSAGGMHPKAVVLYNAGLDEIRSGFAAARDGDVACILKFDGVGVDAAEERPGAPLPFNRVEAAYARMAGAAGIDVAGIDMLETAEGHAHLLVRRFDLEDGTRLHQHSLGGMLHVDYNEPGASSYEEYLRTILRLGMSHASIEQGYRRMVFNIMAVNQDDHVKNLSFHMRPDGKWSLSPAFDLTFARGQSWTANHQMRVADKTASIRRHDMLEVGEVFGIRAPHRILAEVDAAVADWPDRARETSVPAGTVRAISSTLAERQRSLASIPL